MDGGSIVVGLRLDGSNLVSPRWQVRPTQNETKWERSLDIKLYKVEEDRDRKRLPHE